MLSLQTTKDGYQRLGVKKKPESRIIIEGSLSYGFGLQELTHDALKGAAKVELRVKARPAEAVPSRGPKDRAKAGTELSVNWYDTRPPKDTVISTDYEEVDPISNAYRRKRRQVSGFAFSGLPCKSSTAGRDKTRKCCV